MIAAQWPGDYLWMYPAMVLMLLFVALVAAVHECAPPARRVFSLLALCIAAVAAAVLLIDYYPQVSIMQPSLEKGQLDGWSMLTMYNPNGVFIALEELGYLLMSIVFLCLARVFVGKTGVERALRWLLQASFAASILSLVVVSAVRGIDRGDAFEINRHLDRLADAHRRGGADRARVPTTTRRDGLSPRRSRRRAGSLPDAALPRVRFLQCLVAEQPLRHGAHQRVLGGPPVPAREWCGRLRVRLTAAARAKAVAGLDQFTRAALEQTETKAAEDALPALDNVVSLAGRRRWRYRWTSVTCSDRGMRPPAGSILLVGALAHRAAQLTPPAVLDDTLRPPSPSGIARTASSYAFMFWARASPSSPLAAVAPAASSASRAS